MSAADESSIELARVPLAGGATMLIRLNKRSEAIPSFRILFGDTEDPFAGCWVTPAAATAILLAINGAK